MSEVDLYPPIEPFDAGVLPVGEGHSIRWEISGNPAGKPAVLLHGGPGQGAFPNMRRGFDPARYRVVLFDQRGCGGSTPHASDPAAEMATNTTHRLVADMETLRVHLGLDRWLVAGGSWGSTLALVYAEAHPSRVTEIVLDGVTTGRRSEAAWLYGGLRRFFPEAFERFRDHLPEAERGGSLIEAYAGRMNDPDADVRLAAARAWCAWEDAALGLEPNPAASGYSDLDPAAMIAFARICTHYLAHGAWLEEAQLLRDAGRLAGIPAVLIHGRRDMTCPIETAWELADIWPDAKLVVLENTGHLRSNEKRAALLAALDGFAAREP